MLAMTQFVVEFLSEFPSVELVLIWQTVKADDARVRLLHFMSVFFFFFFIHLHSLLMRWTALGIFYYLIGNSENEFFSSFLLSLASVKIFICFLMMLLWDIKIYVIAWSILKNENLNIFGTVLKVKQVKFLV